MRPTGKPDLRRCCFYFGAGGLTGCRQAFIFLFVCTPDRYPFKDLAELAGMRTPWPHILCLPLLAGVVAAAPATLPGDESPDLEQRINALENQVRELKAEQQAINQKREIEATARAVQAECAASKQTAGY